MPDDPTPTTETVETITTVSLPGAMSTPRDDSASTTPESGSSAVTPDSVTSSTIAHAAQLATLEAQVASLQERVGNAATASDMARLSEQMRQVTETLDTLAVETDASDVTLIEPSPLPEPTPPDGAGAPGNTPATSAPGAPERPLFHRLFLG